MSNQPHPAPGFSVPLQQGYPNYPPVQQQPSYPVYPPQQPSYGHQPFPAPMQSYNQRSLSQWASVDLLGYLANATSFNVSQKAEILEAVLGWETGNKYSVKDQSGNKILYVREETACLPLVFCGKIRPFNLSVKDRSGQNVMTFSRDLDCGSAFCGFCCADQVKVMSANGQFLGSVQQEASCFYPKFKIKTAAGQTALRLEGPMCVCGFVTFQIVDSNYHQVGQIRKEWGGVVREMFTDADTFSATFPVNLDPEVKATLLGALFMIDFHYFESSN